MGQSKTPLYGFFSFDNERWPTILLISQFVGESSNLSI
ncbi:hypothetical protein IYQ_22880 [Aeromonas salmonicida subsp. salmonicida 01-B526]|uniref:Uncharacterized protein n=1 Tax=Aeromonas salmonicida subsp. salmonicida 01-B526 TaxID=1076135 RepID=A0ABN0DU98_AERSS|nr:hypothetical protein IYQ_22880 [Aeromonas salmonicida subsp. salmonicida 01-B526]